jgi:Suppressor of fused protein (SUFU)
MSDRPMSAPAGVHEQRLGELVLCQPGSWPMDEKSWKDERHYWPVKMLKAAARFPHEYSTWLFRGHALPHGEPPTLYAASTEFCCAFLSKPVLGGEGCDALQIDRNTKIYFHSLIPIYRDEMDFVLTESPAALQDELTAAGGQ